MYYQWLKQCLTMFVMLEHVQETTADISNEGT